MPAKTRVGGKKKTGVGGTVERVHDGIRISSKGWVQRRPWPLILQMRKDVRGAHPASWELRIEIRSPESQFLRSLELFCSITLWLRCH